MAGNVTNENLHAEDMPSNPFVGPRPFLEDDIQKNRKFYGRDREMRQLLGLDQGFRSF